MSFLLLCLKLLFWFWSGNALAAGFFWILKMVFGLGVYDRIANASNNEAVVSFLVFGVVGIAVAIRNGQIRG